MKRTNLKNLALGGLFGPLIFVLATLINASLRSDYNHVSQFISELGATNTSYAILMNLSGFLPFGLLMVGFGISLFSLLPKGISFRFGSLLILVFGLGVLLAGLFSCDAGCPDVGSNENNTHNQVSAVAFFSAIIGTGILSISFRSQADWKPVWIYSFLTFIASTGFLAAMINSFEASTHNGMWQRLLLLTLFIWFGVVGVRLHRLH
tara:strand:+ start:1619 stop:2239 length:621 start_codon:yes stop_codon:yes gene_type:complete